MSCLKSVSYSVLLNGQPVGSIKPSKGLRQGDLLSPYLFLLCALGLQSLIQKAEVSDDIKGVAICRNRPRVSHLFFANDNVLFYHATEAECHRILEILAVYERGSGKKLTERRLISFLAQTHKLMLRLGFKLYWGSLQFASMRNIWACLLLLVGPRNKALSTSRKEYGRNYRVGRKSSSHKSKGKFF